MIGILLLVILTWVGCSNSPEPRTFPVSGIVTLDGVPLKGVAVMFQPEQGGSFGIGISDSAGRFKITTFELDDGAIPGNHGVIIQKDTASFDATSEGNNDGQKIPPRYGKAETSGLQVEVSSEIQDLELKLTTN
ncbi:MAG: hypothetical protein AAF623_04400 [Planctomycetota bacterium]